MSPPVLTIGISLKMYFGARRTGDWCRAVAELAGRHPAVTSGTVELFVLPAAPLIVPVLGIFAGTPVSVGAQNLYREDDGPFTGEVSGALLRELGCRYAEVGHAERRRLFGEGNQAVAAKVAACWRNDLIPVLCTGETSPAPPEQAAAACVAEISQVLRDAGHPRPLVLAYEPRWAIGQARPAPVEHIQEVIAALRGWLAARPEFAGSRLIYGGSAGPGLLTTLRGRPPTRADGLFLGRFAHDPAAVEAVLDEARALTPPGQEAAPWLSA